MKALVEVSRIFIEENFSYPLFNHSLSDNISNVVKKTENNRNQIIEITYKMLSDLICINNALLNSGIDYDFQSNAGFYFRESMDILNEESRVINISEVGKILTPEGVELVTYLAYYWSNTEIKSIECKYCIFISSLMNYILLKNRHL